MDGIKYAVVTDKSIRLLLKNQYTSNVESGSTRTEIKHWVELFFGVKVIAMNSHRLPGKGRRMRPIIMRNSLSSYCSRDIGHIGGPIPSYMAIHLYKTSTLSTRNGAVDSQVKSNTRNNLIYGQHHCGKGRNSRGIITTRHRGGGHKRLYHKIEFRRNEKYIYGRIVTIEYDPNRNAYICLIHYGDGAIIGDTIISGTEVPIKMGNALPLSTAIHNIEITLGRGGQLARAAGVVAKLIAKEGKSATLKLPSGEVRLISKNCSATVGQVGNAGVNQKSLGRVGSKCWLGKRPTIPIGGGEGRAPIGRKKPATPWGYPALGRRSRKRNKYSDNLILRRRSK
ncbi:hypothetical protein POPTR_011G074401v4 [Populus trichocarpa]|uniref:CCHC-type domain-containing protein n=1 Tax=Populus trichocarpa TaxID=3694 RepID=A0A2K1YH34_POPTR|nr:hypothetical protein POPTR_011G074401v4 [Populus trichocarpa]